MPKYHIYDIEWDTSDEEITETPQELGLPEEIVKEFNPDNLGLTVAEIISDWLFKEYGYCHFGFNFVEV